jgi:hypothetical protein
MNKTMKITIYLLIAFMLMGTEKCDMRNTILNPYVPDPICKRDLEEANRYLTSTYSKLHALDGLKLKETYPNGRTTWADEAAEKQNLASAISTIQSTQKYASKPLQANKIKDGKRRLIEVMIKDLRSHMPILENYDNRLRQIDGKEMRNTLLYGRHAYGTGKHRRAADVPVRKAQLEAYGKIRKVIAIVQEYRKPLADVEKDGCVARS